MRQMKRLVSQVEFRMVGKTRSQYIKVSNWPKAKRMADKMAANPTRYEYAVARQYDALVLA